MSFAAPSRRLGPLALPFAVIALLFVVVPAIASAGIQPAVADLGARDLSQFDSSNTAGGSLAIVDGGYGDTTAAQATYNGGGGNGYARAQWDVSWNEGDDVWYAAAYYLPVGFKADMQGQVALLRWDDWPSHPSDRADGGIVIWGHDKRARLVRELLPSGQVDELSRPFDLPEGRWFWLEVHQRLSSGAGALNEVYLDGNLIDRSAGANTFGGRVIERMRYGLDAIADGAQTRALTLKFDRATVATRHTGPLPELAAPLPGAAPDNTARAANRYTRRVRRCIHGALKRAARRGKSHVRPRAARRCLAKYGKRR